MLGNKFKDLKQVAIDNKKQFLEGEPFPHIVFDDFFDPNVLLDCSNDFPDLAITSSTKFNNPAEIKLASKRGDEQQPESIKQLLRFLNSHEFLDFLQELTSIKEPLVPDPHFCGGGLHEIKAGGLLKVHADFCRHPETGLDRRLNILIYLNQDWKASYGGDLQLWDKEMKECRQKILPTFNRLVIFNTNDFTYHGHPDPLQCPENRSRKSLAIYYFSNGRPSSELRPTNINQSTLFVKRPGEAYNEKKSNSFSMKTIARELLPPVAIKIAKKVIKRA